MARTDNGMEINPVAGAEIEMQAEGAASSALLAAKALIYAGDLSGLSREKKFIEKCSVCMLIDSLR